LVDGVGIGVSVTKETLFVSYNFCSLGSISIWYWNLRLYSHHTIEPLGTIKLMLDSSSWSNELIYLQSWFTTDASIPAQKHCDNTSAANDHKLMNRFSFVILSNGSLTKCLIVSKNTFIKSKLWLTPRLIFKNIINSKHDILIYFV